jgi:hypothetical protein
MSESGVIAFFPWLTIDEPHVIGPIRLLPFQRGKRFKDLPNATQADISGVLAAYSDRPRRRVDRAVLLECAEWQTGMSATDEQARELFRIRNLIAFSALSHRRHFQNDLNYCNTHTYSLIVQRFTPGAADTFSFDTRRRDGRTRHLWGSDEFAFHRPSHVGYDNRVALDMPLLESLLTRQLPSRYYEAIIEFLSANTDSPDVPNHVEVVMCKSAFEWLLGIDEKAKSLVIALERRLEDIKALPCSGPLDAAWKMQYQKLSRPLMAWAREFSAVRGIAAHGCSNKTFVWGRDQHLAFVSMFFPLLLKKMLADDGMLAMDQYDIERLRRIDRYILHDPFDHDWHSATDHPWNKVETDVRMAILAKHL